MVHIDRPSTWRKFSSDMCRGCQAGCCQMPVEVKFSDLERLGLAQPDEAHGSMKKVFNRLKKSGHVTSYRSGTGFFMLTQKNQGDCFFLDPKTRLCQVYDLRPDVCRQFPSIGPRPGYCPSVRIKAR